MNPALLPVIGIVAIVLVYLVAVFVDRRYRKYKGHMVVECPETHLPVDVELDAPHATITEMLGQQYLMLKSCTRWPEREDCDQACTHSIIVDPKRSQLSSRLSEWYRGKNCVYCERPFDDDVTQSGHEPSLMSPARTLVEWKDVRGDQLQHVLDTHLPVCWNCHAAESFRRKYPDLVIDNPWINA